MKLKWSILVMALIAVGIVVVPRRLISSLRPAGSPAVNEKGAPLAVLQTNVEQETSTAEAGQIERLRLENRDLHKLRNEVAQLRKLKPELERAQAENTRLRQARQAREQLTRLHEMPGYVPRETWVDAGFSTPEAVAQTLFWALNAAKFERVIDSLTPDIRANIGKEIQNPTEQQRQQVSSVWGELKGYRISEKTVINSDEVVLGLQAAIFGEKTLKIPLKRVGNEWKISGEPRPER